MARRHFFSHYFELHIPFEVTFLFYLPLGIKGILFEKGMNEKGQVPNTPRLAQALFYYMIGKALTWVN